MFSGIFKPMRCLVVVLLIGVSLGSWLGPSATGFTFMKVGVGARPVAMGQAFTAVADDANALFYNPAGLSFQSRFNANLTMCQMFRDVSYLSGGLNVGVWKRFGIGLGAGYLSATDVRRSELGEELGTFGISDLVVGPGFAWRPWRGLGLGGAAKFVYSRIDSFASEAVSFDGGVLFQPLRYLSLGASLLHLGTPRRFIQEWEYQPVNLRLGASFKLPIERHYLLVASDVSVYPDYGPTVGAGAEGKLDLSLLGSNRQDVIYLRGGYQSGGHLGTWSGFSFGVGYEKPMGGGLSLTVDAVYLSYGILGDAQRVALGLNWIPVVTGR